MILLSLDSILLLFISAGTGIFMLGLLQKIFKQPVYANTLGVILAGLVFQTVYYNLISFWFPVNYVCLLPLFILSVCIFWQNKTRSADFTTSLKKQALFILQPRHLLITIPILLLLAYYWLLPPINADSPGYHYATILWFEKYRVVRGLANVDGRLAYNSAAFILQAPYCFTSLVGQSLYPLNGVLVSLFFLWMVTRVLRSSNTMAALAYFGLLYLLNRVMLCNMSSPTADTLVLVCVAYACIQMFDALLARTPTVPPMLLPVFILLYAVIAKLSAYPALLLLPLVFWQMASSQKTGPLLVKLFLLCLPLYIPWLCRNVLLSGYLFYPVPYIDIFTVDWKAPKSVLLLDYTYIKRLPINFDDGLVALAPPPFPHWVIPWMHEQVIRGMRTDLAVLVAAVCSPAYWLMARLKNKAVSRRAFAFWGILYCCVWLWLANVPEYRFGIVFLSLAIVLPLLYVTQTGNIKKYYVLPLIMALLFIIESGWYIYNAPGRKNIYAFSLPHFILLPLKDKHYYFRNDTATFSYTMLNNGVKLYHQDRAHECINAALPCMVWKYGTIQLRGPNIADGFKNVQDDVGRNYPFVK